MASNRMMRREKKRIRLQRFREKRLALRKMLNDPALDIEQKFEVLRQLEALPRDSSAVRLSHRCQITGRQRGVIRRFGIARSKLREYVMKGELPGVVKSSW